MLNLDDLERQRVLAAEQEVIASIPKELRDHMRQANEKFAAGGGCPGCGSKQIAVHYLPCSVDAQEVSL